MGNQNMMSTYLHSLYEQQAELHPDAIALKFKIEEVTYQELNIRSNNLAHYLIKSGVIPGDKVALYFERSIEMIIGILGTLKSGATYVPINPKTPEDRFNFLLEDLENPVIISSKKNAVRISDKNKVVELEETSNESEENPNIKIDINSPAVILYTSGSTGYPKGVLLSHKSLVNRIIWDRNTYSHSENDIVLQHASYHFDFSILEIFMALANGGKLILARPEFHYEGFYLIDLIQKEKITKMGSVPSLLNAFINLSSFEKCTSLKQLFLGGETLHSNLQNLFFSKSSAELINIYGPTEASISVLNWTCKRNDKDNIVPIGYPVAGATIYLLDESKQTVTDGDVGEIYIAGPGVALGYFKRSELTESHFLINPFPDTNNEFIYKTGDLGKKLSNGAFQFIGRKDNQIKMHGLRIELEEIEHYLNLNQNIASSVVTKIKTGDGLDKLVAYLVPVSSGKLNIDDIKSDLLKNLPDYMVPGLFVQMDKFPMTLNGKINREALPYPDKLRIITNNTYTPAENETQKRLIHIWEKVLKTKPIGIKDSFYAIGGDSLALLEMHHFIETELDFKLPFSSLSNSITIQDQAKIIDSKTGNLNKNSELIHLNRKGDKTPILLVGGIHGVVPASNLMMEYIDSGHPFLVTVPFGMDLDSVPENVEECAKHYAHTLENQYPYNEYIIGGHSLGGLIALEIASILKNKGKSIKFLFLIDTFHPKTIKNITISEGIQTRMKFYLKKFTTVSFKIKIELINFLIGKNIRKIKTVIVQKSSNKKDNHNLNYKHNLLLALNYIPKQYNGKVILISARQEEKSYLYIDQYLLNQKEVIISNWKEVISGEFLFYEISSSHTSIMKNPSIKIVANIITDHL